MPLLLMLWCNVVKRNWTIILMQTVLNKKREMKINNCLINAIRLELITEPILLGSCAYSLWFFFNTLANHVNIDFLA